MKKGILIVTKKGSAKIKRDDNKQVTSPKTYLYNEYIPESGKRKIDCEYEDNEKGQILKVCVEGVELPRDIGLVEKRDLKAKKEQATLAALKKDEEAEKKYASHFKNDLLPIADYQHYWPKDIVNLNLKSIHADNYALKLNKLAAFDPEKDKFVSFVKGKNDVKQFVPLWEDSFFKDKVNRQKIITKELFGAGKFSLLKLKLFNRLALGLGNASIYETSMTLHHIYGVPYLPASSIKGVVRNWILQECFSETKEAEEKAMEDQLFIALFGGDYKKEKYQGGIVFLDAFPTAAPEIEVDVMNPHYGKWYNNQGPPTDTDKPNPIFFLTVAADTEFQFLFGENKNYVGWSSLNYKDENGIIGKLNMEDKSPTLLNIIQAWTKNALQNHGLGAKTAVGYGFFK